jgi:hypothetical protein
MAHEVAVESLIPVARILDPLQSRLGDVTLQRVAVKIEQRSQVLSSTAARAPGHRGQPGHTCAADELQEQGLELIFCVVSGQQNLGRRQRAGKKLVPSLSRHGFERLSACHFDTSIELKKRHGQLSGELRALFCPDLRMRMQVMVDMDGSQFEATFLRAQSRQALEQRGGVSTAAESDTIFRARGRTR